MIRAIDALDFEQLRNIYKKWYRDVMPFPNFMKNCICAFVSEEGDGLVTSACAVNTIIEVQLLTDKDRPVRTRVRALNELFDASKFFASRNGYNNLNVFVKAEDTDWRNQLIRKGFEPENILTLEL